MKQSETAIRLCHLEFLVPDLEAALIFYGNSFAWKAVPIEIHDIAVLELPEQALYGITLRQDRLFQAGIKKNGIIPYFQFGDIKHIRAQVMKAGGQVDSEEQLLPGYGRLSTVLDPFGNRIGLFEQLPA